MDAMKLLQLLMVVCGLMPDAASLDVCNQTVNIHTSDLDLVHQGATLTLTGSGVEASGRSLYCWLRLVAGDDQYVEVSINYLNVGHYDYERKRCADGYLKVSESESGFHPTVLCGDYTHDNIRVKRYTTGPSALVELTEDNPESSKGYELDVIFKDKDPQDTLPYGHTQRRDGKIENTDCSWLIPVEQCFGTCRVVSPGYPGIYPPDVSCRYIIMNHDDGRAQVAFGGKHSKFNIKDSTNCSADYIAVYDGSTSSAPLIGRYCGRDSDFIISSGTTLLVEFHTAANTPPYTYEGFELKVVDRWKNHHDFGSHDPTTLCDWSFSSLDSASGDLHTPDHMLHSGTMCVYTFSGRRMEMIKLDVKVHKLLPNCTEYIEVFKGHTKLDTICEDRIHAPIKTGEKFSYEAYGSPLTLRYHSNAWISSNEQPTWVTYEFKNLTKAEKEARRAKHNKDAKKNGQIGGTECDQLLPVETCYGLCRLTSPAYPKTYPSGLRCHYTLTNNDGARVQLEFGGVYGIFNLRDSTGCTDDFLAVYDGVNASSPLIGRYCGRDSDYIISSGPSLFVVFESREDMATQNQTRFELKYTDRWEHKHEYGNKDSLCDWTFNSSQSYYGKLHTPDHMVVPNTTCWYTFNGRPGETVEVKVKLWDLGPDCSENLKIYDGSRNVRPLDTICGDRIQDFSRVVVETYTSTRNVMTVRFHSDVKRASNNYPTWIEYEFLLSRGGPEPNVDADTPTYAETKENGAMSSQRPLKTWALAITLGISLCMFIS